MFSQQDLKQMKNRGMELPVIMKQIDHFVKGFPFIRLARPAVPGDGLLTFGEEEKLRYTGYFEQKLPGLRIVKFVPASGAASRMFKHLFDYREKALSGEISEEVLLSGESFYSTGYLASHIRETAFYGDLDAICAASGLSLNELLEKNQFSTIVEYILTPRGLDYANLPKALLKFHLYADSARTAAEEHLVEAAEYTRDRENKARIHFTISPEHREKFLSLFENVRPSYEKKLGVVFDISYSFQKPSTDTLAVDEHNQPVRNPDETMLFRPGGHGALLENLNEVDADLIFIKNIDNIVPDRLKAATFEYKKLLGGYLLSVRETVFRFLEGCKKQVPSPDELQEIIIFAREKLFLELPADIGTWPLSDRCDALITLLNRPMRVCGMVKNEGEPGGGPFWVTGRDGGQTLQIVEASQIDPKNTGQQAVLLAATHFNPVDLVCSTKDFEGNTFNLKQFIDEDTGFISLKSSGAATLKAQELPGLWNGAMAGWITLFIEVPVITFNPVKTVNDLLRKEHLFIES